MVGTTIGAIDVGSNAIRFVVADVTNDHYELVDTKRIPIRLGAGTFQSGELPRESIDKTVAAFKEFADTFEYHNVVTYRAVATSAVRQAQNAETLLKEIRQDAGIDLEVIDGDEEGRLVCAAMAKSLGYKPNLVADLGGGSLDLTRQWDKHTEYLSLPVGTVRLGEMFSLFGALTATDRSIVGRYTKVQLERVANDLVDIDSVALAGGNASALVELLGSKDCVKRAELADWLKEAATRSPDERVDAYGITIDRAEVVVIAGWIFHELMTFIDCETAQVPGVGIRDGILGELATGLATHKSSGRAAIAAARNFAHRLGHDTKHGAHVASLAKKVFRATSSVHGIPRSRSTILQLSGLLHDVGEVVSQKRHHAHSEYLIMNGRIAGLSEDERMMIAAIARSHRKSPPTPGKHMAYSELSKKQKREVRVLSAILRLADNLDVGHRQLVRIHNIEVSDGQIVIEIASRNGPVDIDRLTKKRAQLEVELECDVVVSVV